MAESSTPEEMLSSDKSSVILNVTDARVLRVEFTSCQSWPHETSWTCTPTPNLCLNTPELRAQLGELKERWESCGEHLTSIRNGSLIFVFGHDTEYEAIQMAARHLEIKEAILLFLQEIGSQVKNISMEAVVQEAKRTAKKQQKESGQIIAGMDGDSTAIHSNVSGTQNVQEMHQELGNMHISGDVSVNINVNCEGGSHETSWHINPAPDKHISQVPKESFHRLGRWIREFCLATLISVTRGSLIFSFAHSTSEDAIDMIVKHRKVREVFLDFVQELDPSIEDIRIEVVLRELSVSEEQTTQITGLGSHSSGYSLGSHSSGYSLGSHSSGYSLGSHSSGYSSGSHSSGYTSSDPSLKPLVKGQDSDQHASIDLGWNPSQSDRDPWLPTASYATPSRADRDLYFASGDGDLEEVKRLLSTAGANVNSRVWSWTPVMMAAVWGHRDVVALLVSEGADVSLVDKNGNNILHFACRGGDVETVEFVLSLNVVDIDARNNSGETAADWARLGRRQPVVELLVPRGAQ